MKKTPAPQITETLKYNLLVDAKVALGKQREMLVYALEFNEERTEEAFKKIMDRSHHIISNMKPDRLFDWLSDDNPELKQELAVTRPRKIDRMCYDSLVSEFKKECQSWVTLFSECVRKYYQERKGISFSPEDNLGEIPEIQFLEVLPIPLVRMEIKKLIKGIDDGFEFIRNFTSLPDNSQERFIILWENKDHQLRQKHLSAKFSPRFYGKVRQEELVQHTLSVAMKLSKSKTS